MIPADPALGLAPEDLGVLGRAGMGSGRRTAKAPSSSGRHQRSVPVRPGEPWGELAPAATLRAAVRRTGAHGRIAPLEIRPEDLHRRVRMSRSGRLILLVVDTSESMGAGAAKRIAAAKGTVLTLLGEAHLQRDRVGMVTFQNRSARVVLAPTRSMELARARLQALPVGGATPLSHGLYEAWNTIRQERHKNSLLRPLLILLTDGEANVPLLPGRSVEGDLMAMAARISADRIPAMLVHAAEHEKFTQGMRNLARRMGASYHRLRRIRPGDLTALLLPPSRKKGSVP